MPLLVSIVTEFQISKQPKRSCQVVQYVLYILRMISASNWECRSVSIIFRAQHDASWKHFEGPPQFSDRPNSPKEINNLSSNSLSSNHSLTSIQTASIPLTTHSTNPTPTATSNKQQTPTTKHPPHHNNHHNCSSAWVGAFANSFYHGTTKVWTCDDGKAHLETWLSWHKARCIFSVGNLRKIMTKQNIFSMTWAFSRFLRSNSAQRKFSW